MVVYTKFHSRELAVYLGMTLRLVAPLVFLTVFLYLLS